VKKQRFSYYFPLITGAADVAALCVAFLAASVSRFVHLEYQNSGGEYMDFITIAPIIWFLIAAQNKLYTFVRIDSIDKQIRKTVYTLLLYFSCMFVVIVALDFDQISRLWLFYFSLYLFIIVILVRILFNRVLINYRKRGGNYRKIIVVGSDKISTTLYNYLEKNIAFGYRVEGYFTPSVQYFKESLTGNMRNLGNASQVLDYLKANTIDEVFWKVGQEEDPQLKEIIDYCENNLIRFKLIPYFGVPISGRQPNIDLYQGIPIVTLRKEPLQRPFNRLMKRLFDFLFSLLVLLIITPLIFPWIAIAIKLNSKGPVFFKQLRSGENNIQFWCYKFRTMSVNILSDELQATKNDLRITSVGRFLRKTNFDELPQFYNVFKGDMTVVGPRPHMLKHTEDYSKLIGNFLVRQFAKPGITGWAQVTGLRGETSEVIEMKKRVDADIWYLENWSFFLDIRIIFMTIQNMIAGDKNAV
jgi:undecaprenyl-phosphate galactose phosphotransferase/putative colanic acid biosynthesis UDP-glucose lipid carrier transferase